MVFVTPFGRSFEVPIRFAGGRLYEDQWRPFIVVNGAAVLLRSRHRTFRFDRGNEKAFMTRLCVSCRDRSERTG